MYSILYVDDDPALLDIGRIFLNMSGHFIVDTCSSVSDAIEKIRTNRYDAIVSDYEMGGINGIEFLKYVRQQYKDLPFILFTGRGREDIVIEALNTGADFYLQKGGEPKSQFAELEYKIRTAIERRRVQDELKESRKQLSDLINFLPDATFAIDLKGRVIVWNRMMEELTGVPPDAVIGTGNVSGKLPLYEGKQSPLADYIVHTGGEPEKEYPNLRRNGDKLLAEMYHPPVKNGKGSFFWHTASPLYDVKGNVIGAIESVRDVTQRKETEERLRRTNEELNAAYEQLTATEEELRANYEELARSEELIRQSEERYHNVIEDQTEFICRFTPEGKLSFVNNAYCRYFGLDPETCLGKPHTVTVPKEDAVQMRQELAALTPQNPVATISNRILMPDGSVRWQQWSDRAIFDRDGRIIEIQSVGRDITRERDAEDKLKLAYEEMHSAYEQLTATEEELRANYEELARSEELIRQSEERYRNVVEDQTEFVCRFTPTGNLTFVNEAYCRYFSLDRDTCIGKPHTVVIPQQDLVRMKAQLSKFTPDNPVAIIEHQVVMPSGEIRWQRWSDRAIFDRDGRIIEFQSVGRDTTDRVLAEEKLRYTNEQLHSAYEELTATEEELRQNYEALAKSEERARESEERYRDVVEDQTEFICRFTPDGKLTFVNGAYCRYFDLDPETCIGKLHTVKIPPEDLVLVREQLARLSPDNSVAGLDHRILMLDGTVRWHHWHDRAIFDAQGHIVEYQSVGRDTTLQKVAEEKLKLAYEDQNAAYEQLTSAEEELRQNYDEMSKKQMELNAAYEQLTAVEEEVRSNFEELARNEQALRRSEERYRNVVEDQTEFICRFTPDGKLTFVNGAYCRYFDLDPETCVGKTHPVTIPPEDLPLMKEALARITPDRPVVTVDHRIVMPDGGVRWQHWSDRAIFDDNGRIIEYQSVGRDITERKRMEEALAESNKKLNLLSSITRHDIINQLTALQGSLGLLELEIANPDQLRLLAKAIQSSEVIQSQIMFTQQYQDIGVKKPRWQNLHAAVTTVCMDNGYSNIMIDPALEQWEVYADPLLRMVFLNLFENAAMHGGKMTGIHVSGSKDPDGFVIAVEDDGEGVAPDEKKRIFEKGVGKHTGLGLFLAQEVLAITGLSISETGEYGKGARFEIRVPQGTFRHTGPGQLS